MYNKNGLELIKTVNFMRELLENVVASIIVPANNPIQMNPKFEYPYLPIILVQA